MTLGRFFLCVCSVMTLWACGSDESGEWSPIGDEGYHLMFLHSPSEMLTVYNARRHSAYKESDLRVLVTSIPRTDPAYSSPQLYYDEGDKTMEQQMRSWIDPDGTKYNGDVPVVVEYRTEVCESISIKLYDKDDVLISDITDKARFRDAVETPEVGSYLLFDSSKKLLGKIREGTTIEEYLSQRPLVFAEAFIIFPELDADFLNDGNYVRVEIALDNGLLLTANSR